MKIASVVWPLVFSAGFVCGCTSVEDQPKTQAKTQGEANSSDSGGSGNDDNLPKRRVHKDGKGIIGKKTNEIVDLYKALEKNPKLKIVTNRISGSDPLTQSMSAYSLGSRVQMQAFKHDLDIARNFGDGSPLSYDDVVKRMKKYGIELNMLFAWQKYAYDSKKGDIVILEDAELKAKILDD